jgi:SAM-dependent methyltransferase
MEAIVFQRMASDEDTHWWFRGRRAFLERLLGTLNLPEQSTRLLEVGCGTGGNLALLQQFGRLDAVEFDPAARVAAEAKAGFPIGFCELPSRIDAAEKSYDVVALLDVLEHVDEDVNSLKAVAAKAREGGYVVITVPAHPWLWSAHDDVHHHKRRYTRRTLKQTIAQAGLSLESIGAFNMLLLPAALAQRAAKRLLGDRSADDRMPPAPINRLLTRIFMMERHFAGRVPLPIGLSLFAVARKFGGDVSS